MQNGKSPNSVYLGTVEGAEGEAEKEGYTGEGTLKLGKWESVM